VSAHVEERLSAYLDGELAPAERQEVEAHLRGCDECARRLADFAALDALARDLPVEAPFGYFEALPGRVRFKVSARSRGPARLPAWSWAVAAALVAAVVTPILLRQNPGPAAVAPPAKERAEGGTTTAPVKPLPSPAAGGAAESELRASVRDEEQARRDEGVLRRKVATPPPAAAPAPSTEVPPTTRGTVAVPQAPAPAAGGGLALARVAQNEAPAPAALAKDAPPAVDKLQETRPAAGRAQAAPAASAAFAAPPEQGPAGQHLYEPKAESDVGAAGAAEEAKKSVSGGNAAPAAQEAEKARSAEAPATKLKFRTLLDEVPQTVEGARRLREEWRAFLAQGPSARQADEARVRIIEVGLRAFRLSNDPADLLLARRDAEAYLRRDDAAQGHRVRSLLATLGN
jgi:hypothetical protein